jgi:hypothetical protein
MEVMEIGDMEIGDMEIGDMEIGDMDGIDGMDIHGFWRTMMISNYIAMFQEIPTPMLILIRYHLTPK